MATRTITAPRITRVAVHPRSNAETTTAPRASTLHARLRSRRIPG